MISTAQPHHVIAFQKIDVYEWDNIRTLGSSTLPSHLEQHSLWALANYPLSLTTSGAKPLC